MDFEGSINNEIVVTYDSELKSVEENKRIRILGKIAHFAKNAQSEVSLLELCLEAFKEYFPQAQRITLLTYENGELIPRFFLPNLSSHFSYALANMSLEKKCSFIWSKKVSAQECSLPSSLIKVCSALYAPIIYKKRILGLIHFDSISENNAFSNYDLQLISIIANTLGPALMVRSGDGHKEFSYVFVSYSHNEKDFVIKLVKLLRKNQIRVWFDERIELGHPWRREIAKAINSVDILIWVVSPACLNSEIAQWEVNLGRINGKLIIPIIYEPSCLPSWAKETQYITYSQNFELLIRNVSKKIKESLEDAK